MNEPELLRSIDQGLEAWDKLPQDVQWAKIMDLERRMGLRRDEQGRVIYPPPFEHANPPAADDGQAVLDDAESVPAGTVAEAGT